MRQAWRDTSGFALLLQLYSRHGRFPPDRRGYSMKPSAFMDTRNRRFAGDSKCLPRTASATMCQVWRSAPPSGPQVCKI